MQILAAATLLFLQAVPQHYDYVYVREADRPGVSQRMVGRVIDLDLYSLTFESDGKTYLFTREAVTKVELHAPRPQLVSDEDDDPAETAAAWGAQGTTILVETARSLGGPQLGAAVAKLDTDTQSGLLFFVVLAGLSFGGYRAYDWSIGRREARELNVLRTKLELTKMRREALALTEPHSFDRELLETLRLPAADAWFAERDALDAAAQGPAAALVFAPEERARKRVAYRASAVARLREGRVAKLRMGAKMALFALLALFFFLYGWLCLLGILAITDPDPSFVIYSVVTFLLGILQVFLARSLGTKAADLFAALRAARRTKTT